MARRVHPQPEKIGEFLQDCLELRQILQGSSLSEMDYQIVKTHLEALLTDLDRSIKREQAPQ
jgi:hypothetical protein